MKKLLNEIISMLIEKQNDLIERQSEYFFRAGMPVQEKLKPLKWYEIEELDKMREEYNDIESLLDFINLNWKDVLNEKSEESK